MNSNSHNDIRKITRSRLEKLIQYTQKIFSEDHFVSAWNEFFDGEEDFMVDHPLMETMMPWFIFSWESEEGVNPCLAYLLEHIEELTDIEKEYFSGCIKSSFTFYEVKDVTPGVSLQVYDLIGKGTSMVYEKSGSQALKKGDLIFAKPVTIAGHSFFEACAPIIIPSSYKLDIVKFAQQPKYKKDYELSRIDLFVDIYFTSMNPVQPTFTNTDGHLLIPQKLVFEIDDPKLTSEALAPLCKDHHDPLQFPWLSKNDVVLGSLTIKKNKLTVEVNSNERAKAFIKLINKLMPKGQKLKTTLIESLEQTSPSDFKVEDHPEIEALLKQRIDEHWNQWPHMKVPALGNKTPIQLIKTKKGRELVDALISDFEKKVLEFPVKGQTLETFQELRLRLKL